ncbi:hypothetical protein V8D89_003640 [Ganoderma adspersum]
MPPVANELRRGGIDELLAERCALILVLFQAKPDSSSDSNNSARSFELLAIDMVYARRAESHIMDDIRLALEARCRSSAAANMMCVSLPEDWEERLAFAGFVTAIFHIQSTGMALFHSYPVYRLSFEHVLP